MKELEVVLVVVSPSLAQRGAAQYLLLAREDGKFQLPVAAVGEDETSLVVAADLLYRYAGIKARLGERGWVDLRQHPLVEGVLELKQGRHDAGGDPWFDVASKTREAVAVPYSALLPAEVAQLSDPRARWVPAAEALAADFAADHKSILQGVSTPL